MLLEAMLAAAMLGIHSNDDRSLVLPVGRLVASPRPWPAGRVDDVHRPGFSKVWIGRTARSREGERGRPVHPLDWRSPGPGAYGAAEDDGSVAYIRVGHNIVGVSPWERQSFSLLEEGRRQWLDEHGYTGGVRTFVSDERLRHSSADGHADAEALADRGQRAPAIEPEPRAIIELPEDMPRQKSRLRVDAGKAPAVKAVGTAPTPTPDRPARVVHVPAGPRPEPIVAQAKDR